MGKTNIVVDAVELACLLVFMDTIEHQIIHGPMKQENRMAFQRLIDEAKPVWKQFNELIESDEWGEAHAWANKIFGGL